jgi:molecular chaperone DnaK
MVREGEQHAAEDQQRKELIEARNLADNLVYQAEKSLRDLGEKADTAARAEVEHKIADTKKALESDDKSHLDRASQELQQAMMKLGQAAYQPQAGDSAPNGNGHHGASSSTPNREEVVDGEFSEA